MTFVFRCPRTGVEFERLLAGYRDLLHQPCDDCDCPVRQVGQLSHDHQNRVFTPAAINVPRPRFKGGYDAHTHKRFANGAARERYMDANNLTLERG